MKKQYKQAIEKIDGMAERWQHDLGLDWVDIQHRYLETFAEDDHLTVADTEAMWEYRLAVVRWFLPSLVRLDDSEIEDTLIHEYSHILLAPIEGKLPDKHLELKEFCVEGLTKAIKGAYYAPKRKSKN